MPKKNPYGLQKVLLGMDKQDRARLLLKIAKLFGENAVRCDDPTRGREYGKFKIVKQPLRCYVDEDQGCQ